MTCPAEHAFRQQKMYVRMRSTFSCTAASRILRLYEPSSMLTWPSSATNSGPFFQTARRPRGVRSRIILELNSFIYNTKTELFYGKTCHNP